MSVEPSGSVSYTIKELLANLDGKIDTIILTLSGKADVSDLVEVERRVAKLESKVILQAEVNEALKSSNAENFTRREKVLGVLIACGALAVQLYVQFGG